MGFRPVSLARGRPIHMIEFASGSASTLGALWLGAACISQIDGFCSQQAAFNNGGLSGQVSGFSSGVLNVRFTTCGSGTATPPTTKK